jgi:hypothetical protein
MSDGGLSDMFRAIGYVGAVKAVRQDYQVFRTAGGEFLVFSPSSRSSSSFHMARVSVEKADVLRKIVQKEDVTSGSLMRDDRVRDVFGSEDKVGLRFDLLMTLYVLAALGEVEMAKSGRNLSFSSKKG